MKNLVILVLAAIAGLLFWNQGRSGYTASPLGIPVDTSAPVPPEITGAIITKFQETHPELQPIETLFINPQKDGSYNSRFMFFNTKHFFGTQYDVRAMVEKNGNVTINETTESAVSEPGYGYVPDKYLPYKDVTETLNAQFKQALSQPIPQPNLDNMARAHSSGMTITQTNLETRF
jgi:hypothetical protein